MVKLWCWVVRKLAAKNSTLDKEHFIPFFFALYPMINDSATYLNFSWSFCRILPFLVASSSQIHFTASAPDWRRNNMFLSRCVFLVRGHPFSRGPDVFNWQELSRAQAPVSQQAAVHLVLCCSVLLLPATLANSMCHPLLPSQKLGWDLQYKGGLLHNTLFLSNLATKCVRAKAEESPCSGNVMQTFLCFQGEKLHISM